MSEPTRVEIVNVMKDGGIRLCDYAIEQWEQGKYGSDLEMRRINVARWRAIRDGIRALAKEIR